MNQLRSVLRLFPVTKPIVLLLAVLLFAMAMLPLCLPAATGSTGTIAGTVTDPSGAVIENAEVVVREASSNAMRETSTNKWGEYIVALVPPGHYYISVEHSGFRRVTLGPLRLDVNQTLRANIVLPIGPVSSELRVSEPPPRIEVEGSTRGQIIDRQKISGLPLNERKFLAFALLATGVHPAVDGSMNSSQALAIHVNGAREDANNFLLDGVDNNDATTNLYSVLPPLDAVDEFKVQSSNSTAEFGRNSGAQINVVLKSGTNELHGGLFEFMRNRHLDAKNYFDRPACVAGSLPGSCGDTPRFDRNQFGGFLGAPIRRNRLFSYAAYEGLVLRQAVTRRSTVPSQQQRAAVLAAVPVAQRDPAGLAALDFLPAANFGPDLSISNVFLAAPVLKETTHSFVLKLDYLPPGRDTFSGHYALLQEDRSNPFDPLFPFTNLPGHGSQIEGRAQNLRLSWIHTAHSRRIHELRLGYNRTRRHIWLENSDTNGSRLLGFPELFTRMIDQGFPAITIAGFDGIGDPLNLPQGRTLNTIHFSHNFFWNPDRAGGRHRLQFGWELRRVQFNHFEDIGVRGQWVFLGLFTGNPLVDLVRGLPSFGIVGRGIPDMGLRTWLLDFYAQDNFRVSPHLTLNLGLRYENSSPPTDIRDRLSLPDLSANSLTCLPKPDCQFLVAGKSGLPRGIYARDNNNVAPRIGLAWSPTPSGRFALRAAYGIYYDVGYFVRNLFSHFNPPFYYTPIFPNDGTRNIQTIMSLPASPVPVLPFGVDRSNRDAYGQQWLLDVQAEIRQGWVMDVAYVGTKGTRLLNLRDINQPRPGPGPRPYPGFGSFRWIESAANSTHHALQARTEWHFSRGLTFLVAYTWSKTIDTASTLNDAFGEHFPQDSYNCNTERGLSSFHTKHRFVLSYIYQLPFGRGKHWLNDEGFWSHLAGGWELAGIATIQSGRPFTAKRAIPQSFTSTDLGVFDRPDQIADPFVAGPVATHPDPRCQLTISQGGLAADRVRTTATWFNPCAFSAPPGPRFGTASRNTLIGPDLRNWDISLQKTFSFVPESHRLYFRVEFFNLFNHPNFDNPDRIFDSPTFATLQSSNAFGSRPPRQIQIGLKYTF